MGRWSELREVEVDQVKEELRWAEEMVMSGEVGLPLEGRRVGESVLTVMREDRSTAAEIASPQASDRDKNQDP